MTMGHSVNAVKKPVMPRNASATKKIPTRSKLAPLNDRVRTPNVDDEVRVILLVAKTVLLHNCKLFTMIEECRIQ